MFAFAFRLRNSRNGVLRRVLMAACLVAIVFAGGTFVQVVSTNPVSASGPTEFFKRFEPSSSVGTTGNSWAMSWDEYTQPPAYVFPQVSNPEAFTGAWNGSKWTQPFKQTLNGASTGDLFLTFNPSQGLHDLVMLTPVGCELAFRTSTDSSATNWNTPVTVASPADYPSVAVATNGTIVIGGNTADCLNVHGSQAYASTNGGQSWTGPHTITTSATQTFGRVVASGNTFHFLYVDRSNPPNFVLKRKQSSDGGVTWVDGSPAVLDTYTMPKPTSSPDKYCANPPYCNAFGTIYYSVNIDAAAATGLGWVVTYPVARSDNPTINNLKFCAENLAGCSTVSYSNDLFLQGVTTSASGDLWLAMHTYATTTGHTLPLQQIAVYRKPDGTFLNGSINPSIDPTSWAVYFSDQRCANQNCFIAGDYMRLAMNSFTGASLPFIMKSSQDQTDLVQKFVQDPAAGVSPVPGLQIGPLIPFGSDSTFPGGLSAEEIQNRSTGTYASAYYLRGGR